MVMRIQARFVCFAERLSRVYCGQIQKQKKDILKKTVDCKMKLDT